MMLSCSALAVRGLSSMTLAGQSSVNRSPGHVHAGRHDAAERLAELDKHCEAAYEHLVREALDGSLTLHTRAFVQGQHLLCCLSGPPQDPASPPASEQVLPFVVTNDVDLATLISTVRGEMDDTRSS